MAESRFKRSSEESRKAYEQAQAHKAEMDRTAPVSHVRQEKKPNKAGSFLERAKSAVNEVKGIFSSEPENTPSRTAREEPPFEPVQEQRPPQQAQNVQSAPPAQNAQRFQPKQAQPQSAPQMPAQQRFQPKQTQQNTPPAPPVQSQPQQNTRSFRTHVTQEDRTAIADPTSGAPRRPGALPSRWEATHSAPRLTFSDGSFMETQKNDDFGTFDDNDVAPQFSGEVVELPRNQIEDDIGDHHEFVPKIEINNEARHERFRKKTRRPLRMWQKSLITGSALICSFIALIFLAVTLMLVGKMNHIDISGSGQMNDLYYYSNKDKNGIKSVTEEDLVRLSALNDIFENPDLVVKEDENVRNYLFIGMDASNGQADAIMLASVDTKTKKVRLVSFVPELYVKLREQIDGKDWGSSLRNVCAYGGAELLCDTIEYNFKIPVEKYFALSFTAFETVVNHLGGADITISDETLIEWLSTNKISPQTRFVTTGKYILNGEEALIYSRAVKTDSEFSRISRQQTVMSKLTARASELSRLELVSVLYNALSYVGTNCSAAKMLNTVGRLPTYCKYEVKGVCVPIEGTYKESLINGKPLLAANITVNANDIQQFLYENNMTYAEGGVEVNVALPVLTDVEDPEPEVSDPDLSASDLSQTDIEE